MNTDPNSAEWRDRMDDALTTGNIAAMADLLLAGPDRPMPQAIVPIFPATPAAALAPEGVAAGSFLDDAS